MKLGTTVGNWSSILPEGRLLLPGRAGSSAVEKVPQVGGCHQQRNLAQWQLRSEVG